MSKPPGFHLPNTAPKPEQAPEGFTAPRKRMYGEWHPPTKDRRGSLSDGQRCGLCATTDAAVYAACKRRICFSEPIPRSLSEQGFASPAEYVSSFELAARFRRKADALDWEQDAERERLLKRASELLKGEPMVPNEVV